MKHANKIIADAHAELNHRSRGRDARLVRLENAGAPLDLAELRKWTAAQERQAAEAAGSWFRPTSVRCENAGAPDMPTFGPFAPRIEITKLYVEESEEYPGEWYWRLPGRITGGPFDSEAESILESEQAITVDGWTRDLADAERLAIEAARVREVHWQNQKSNQFLIEWRRHRGFTQAKTAEILGTTKNTIARWERGEMRMQNPQQVRLALAGAEHAGLISEK